MSDTEMVLGELKEFKRATLVEIAELRREVRELMSWKWKALGALAAVVMCVQAAWNLVTVKR